MSISVLAFLSMAITRKSASSANSSAIHTQDTIDTLKEVRRALKRVEWRTLLIGLHLIKLLFDGVQILDGFETISDNVNGLLPELFLEAGLRMLC